MSTEKNIAQMPESEEEIDALVSEIAAVLNAIAKSEAAKGTPLAKAAPPPSPEDEGSEPSPEPSAEPSPEPSASAGPPEGPPAEGVPADDGAAPPPGGPEGAPPEGGGAPSVEELVQLFSQLPDDQFENYFMAIQQVAEMKQGGGASPDAGAGAPPPGPSAAPAGPPPGGAPMAMSEHDKAEIEGLKKSVKLLTDALETVTNAPLRKSVTRFENGIAYIPYQDGVKVSEGKPLKKSLKELTKSEIHERLKEVTADPKLAKSDRELINGYYARSVGVDKLEKFFQ